MPIFNPGGTESTLVYDRNPGFERIVFGASGRGPAAEATLDTYTVPGGRKAIIDSAMFQIVRDAAAGAVSTCAWYLKVNSLVVSGLEARLTAVNDREWSAQALAINLIAGDVVDLTYLDSSTGGTCRILGTCSVTEFDA